MSNHFRLKPLSFAQKRLWYLAQLEPEKQIHNISVAYRVSGLINISLLEQSFKEIGKRHQILRTSFSLVDGQPQQVIFSDIDFTLPLINLDNLSQEAQETEIQLQATREFQKPFNLAQQPLWRATILRLSQDEHILLLTTHHIIFDWESLNFLFEEVAGLYEALLQHTSLPQPKVFTQYSDLIEWQNQRVQNEALQAKLDYWKHQLNGQLPILQLLADHTRPAGYKYQKANKVLVLPKSLITALETLSQQENVALSTILLTAFKLLLYRYSGQKDICVASLDSGRNQMKVNGLLGLFTKYFVLRTHIEGNPSFQELLRQVNEVRLEACINQDFSLDSLLEELQLQKNQNFSSPFQVMFSFQSNQIAVHKFSGLMLEPIFDLVSQPMEIDSVTAKFDLALEVQQKSDEIKGWFKYSTDLFDEATITRMVGHFQTLLEGIVTQSQASISELPILTDAERYQILVEWNNTKVDYPLNKSIYQLFEEQVARKPNEIAVIFEHQELTYQKLNSDANQLAHYLQQLGVKPDTLVGICVERSLEMVVGLLGILKAGGAYVPLDPDYPPDRLAYMLADSQVSILLTQEHLLNQLPPHQAKVICLDKDWQKVAVHNKENLLSRVTPDNLAYVIYTSGSTGKPKGAMNTHRGFYNRLLWMQDFYKLDASDRVLQKTPFSFDVSVWEFFLPLIAGAGLVVAKPGGHKDSAYLVNIIIQQQITTVHFVPSMLQVFLEDKNVKYCQSLKQVICSGEALPKNLQERSFSCLECELYNLYGPTEAAIDVTYWQCERESTLSKVPIGRAIANTQIYILDSYLQPVPIGIPGELHIGGVQIARGYLHRPELTEQKFISSPFNDSEKLYKTGDLVRYLPDGNIEYLSRLDHQVKIRGFRIELGEVESFICQYPGIRETVVIAQGETLGERQLIGYVVFNKKVNHHIADLRLFLKERLPKYMIPSVLMVLNSLPLTPNGKVNRNALPAPNSRLQVESDFVNPRTSVEQDMANIWANVLKIEQVGIHDNFFELGGYSLIAIQIINRIRRILGVELPLHILMEAPTIAKLSACIEKIRLTKQELQT
ncbi:amino acid adenylation domain-containing protein (plasmid) [Nostoc sp. UHCC 0926]|uniref:non-ribosomal peptide synthetase n=1 Tax=Nostoc sp. UHCC 0926 TaxID=3025190 RepID=UPI00235E2CD2|nr:amino acid adenylation domain-containing protein [Nostoc sp. UHCC 0926]WDD30116.1 amino acid adenylation domain-containing protein [Nostoc sp. UHCC 0926]